MGPNTPSRALAVLLDGPLAAPPPADPAAAVAIVAQEIARGSALEHACAAAGLEPHVYAELLERDPAARAAHERAERVRRAVLADAPLGLARELRDARRARGALAGLGELARAIQAEAALVQQGAGTAAARAEATIRVVLEPLPTYPDAQITPLPDASSVALPRVSDDGASDYDTLAD